MIEPVAAEAVREPVARSVLASIGLGPSGRDTWVDVDGRFRVGRLDGQSSKPYAQYLGRSIREPALQLPDEGRDFRHRPRIGGRG